MSLIVTLTFGSAYIIVLLINIIIIKANFVIYIRQ